MTDDRIRWRLLEDGIRDPFRHFAIEEALLRAVDEGRSPDTLRLRRADRSVWIGVYQVPEEDVDLAWCAERGVPVVRRHNPGGAVYQDEGGFCFSAVFRREATFRRLGIGSPDELYARVGAAIVAACAEFGLRAEVSPVNDVTVGGRKIYGSAQVDWYASFVHSGSFLVSTDVGAMARALRPSALKFADKGFSDVRGRVITLQEAAGRPVPVATAMEVVTRHLATAFRVELQPGPLLPHEVAAAEELLEAKYGRREWTFRPRAERTTVVATKARSGVVALEAAFDGSVLRDVGVTGDFLVPDPRELDRWIAGARGRTTEEAAGLAQGSRLPADVREALARLLRMAEESDGGQG
ncbi:MAG: lipoate--protein ligase family protein [Myxococcales bacterium]|nr:lipoate--protein ligase family protein [Myxococcales bacterium]